MKRIFAVLFTVLLFLPSQAGVKAVDTQDPIESETLAGERVAHYTVERKVKTPTCNYNLTNRAVTLSMGPWRAYDSYLSPLLYKGGGLKWMDERLKMMTKNMDKLSRYYEMNTSFAAMSNPAETASMLYFTIEGVTGVHYHLRPIKNMNLLLGGLVNGEAGLRYSMVNQNNPASLVLDANLWASVMCYYHIRLRNKTLTLRDHFSTPFVGVMFSPNYKQTYYEIFSLHNYDGVYPVTTFGSRWQWRNKLSLDLPIKICTFRFGVLAERSVTEVNLLETRTMNVSAMLGLVYNFNTFKGTKAIPADYRNPVE
ncbi:MAG: DUF3316 domain-containing protein [Paludibacteraceae bacterium]|nr:DUF3316 domain-containing protein [Paludibacteraceae bacterium]